MTEESNDIDLNKLPKDNPFDIPDNYFDNFYIKLQDKISRKQSYFDRIIYILKPQISYAVLLIFFIFIGYSSFKIFYKDNNLNKKDFNNEIITNEMFYINENELTDILCEDNSQIVNTNIKDEDIILYLADNNIDNSEIIEEY